MSNPLESSNPAPRPSLVILDATYSAEVEARQSLREIIRKIAFLSLDQQSRAANVRLEAALDSMVHSLAEEFSKKDTPLENTIHLRSVHFEAALSQIAKQLIDDPVKVLGEVEAWREDVTKSLVSTLATSVSKREAVFRTCERFNIDLADFPALFPKLPTNGS